MASLTALEYESVGMTAARNQHRILKFIFFYKKRTETGHPPQFLIRFLTFFRNIFRIQVNVCLQQRKNGRSAFYEGGTEVRSQKWTLESIAEDEKAHTLT